MRFLQTIPLLLSALSFDLSEGFSSRIAFVSNHWRTSSPSLLHSSVQDDAASSTSIDFAMDPYSEEAVDIVTNKLGLTEQQHSQLAKLATLIVEWNENINLISRRDCSVEVVFGRHILPSLAMLQMEDHGLQGRVVDVGTGGGFPGLPLAIALPEVDFLLVDSVGKKLKVVDEVADSLALDNIFTHHGRAEEMVEDVLTGRKHRHAYDVCVGRSVASIPKFCFWVQDLIKTANEDGGAGRLMYIIGGEIESDVLAKTVADVTIEELLDQTGASDKRILVFPQEEVQAIANDSGEVKIKRGTRNKNKGKRKNRQAKGAWAKRDSDVPKQRGYDNFKRYG